MRIQELTVEVRDENLNRVGQFLPVDLVGFSVVNRFNNVGTWEISLPADHKLGIALATPGAGIIVTHSTAGVLLSGPTTTVEAVAKTDDPIGTTRISGVDDSAILAERLAYPTWTTDDVTLQTVSHDAVVAVKASTAMYTFVKHNLATGIAPASRAVPNLVTATDTGLGSTMTKRARFDILGQLLTEIAVIDGLGFDIKQKDNTLQFEVFAPTDRSGYIRMDIQNNTLASSSYGYGLPGLTHAIVAGQGDLEKRQFIQVTTPESTAAQDLWNRRIEQFIDQRNTDVVAELTQAGLEALAESGATLTSVDVVPSSDTTMRFGIDWNLGDTVTVVVGGQEVSAVVTQVALSVASDGIHMVATVGEPMGVDYDALIAKSQVSAMKRIDALERVEGGGGGSASIVVAETPPLDAADNTVFFSSKDGTTAVKYADADSSQWVEIKNPNNYYGDSQITAMGSRLTAVETTVTQRLLPGVSVSGGTKTSDSRYYYHAFTANGSLVISGLLSLSFDYMIVAGGGGGGETIAGGGGGGGVIFGSTKLTAGTYPAVIGGGGAGAPNNSTSYINGSSGGNSSFIGLTAIGGGGGGGYNYQQLAGGSTGGSGAATNSYPVAPTAYQGNYGGNAGGNGNGGAGGGGAGGPGMCSSATVAGNGGPGIISEILGTPRSFGAGGGGGSRNSMPGALGGNSYFGGNGGQLGGAGSSSPANTGGGGGGGGYNDSGGVRGAGGAGGSGIVVVRYERSQVE